jgi:hypothetical protein
VTVKRSGREGRWAEISSPRARFALEAAFLIVVAAGAALAGLSPLGIIGLMLVAWLLVALIERASSREQAKALAGPPEEAPAAERPVRVSGPGEGVPGEPGGAPAMDEVPEVAVGRSWPFGRRRRQAPEALASPEAVLEERPSRAHVTRLEPEAPVAEVEIPVEATEVSVEKPPAPAVTKRPLDLPGLEKTETEREGEPEPEPEPEPVLVPEPVAEAPPPPTPPPPEPVPVPAASAFQAPATSPPAPREWNIWELERRAREQAGDAARDEEWTALFVHLRQFANAEGVLPQEFDDLVRESFAELIQAA